MVFPVSLTVIEQQHVFISGWRPAFSRDQMDGAGMGDLEVYSAGPALPVRVTVRPGDEQFGMPYDEILTMALMHGRGVIDERGRLVLEPSP